MSVAGEKKNNWAIHLIISLAIMYAFRLIPAPEPITPYGMEVLGIFIGMVYALCSPTSTVAWGALLGLIMLGTTDFGNVTTVLSAAFGNYVILMMIVTLLFIPVVVDSGLCNYLFAKIMTSKLCKGNPWRVVYAIQICLLLICFLVNPMVIMFLAYSVFNNIYKLAGYTKKDLFPMFFNMGILLCNCLVAMKFPWAAMALLSLNNITQATGLTCPPMPYMAMVIPYILLTCGGWCLVMRFFPGCDASKLANIDLAELVPESGKMTKMQKASLGAAIALIVGCLLVAFYANAEGNIIQAFLKKLDILGIMALIVAACALITIDGQPLLAMNSAAKSFSWPPVFVFSAATTLGGALTAANTGISAFLLQKLSPILSTFSSTQFLLILAVITIIATNLLSNAAVIVALSAFTVSMFTGGLIDESTMYVGCVMVGVLGDVGVFHPGSSAISAVYHSQEMASPKTAYTVSSLACIYCILTSWIVMVPLGAVFF